MGIALGLLASLLIGCSDFLARFSARRTNALSTTSVALMAGVITTAVAAPIIGGNPGVQDIVLGGLSGVFIGAALALLYHGLSIASASLISPIVAVGTALIPLGWALIRGERPSLLTLTGVAIALVGIAIITSSPDLGEQVVIGTAFAVASAVAFGVAFILVGETAEDAGVWSGFSQRVLGLAAVGALTAGRSLPLRVPTRLLPYALVSGAVGSAGVLAFIAGTQRGDLSTVAVASSLYPAVTAVLTSRFDEDTLRPSQVIGIVVVLVGVGAMTAG